LPPVIPLHHTTPQQYDTPVRFRRFFFGCSIWFFNIGLLPLKSFRCLAADQVHTGNQGFYWLVMLPHSP
uniref:Cytochrome c oxidase subunit 3 n=1 Tax=Mesocestoides corti TaxID=53468 RepID=A0A5K3EXB3_MESCO